jgi:predicted RNase H-like HicB family nuclease
MRVLKFIVEKHSDGYVAYPLGLRGVVVGQGDSYETALADAKSAAQFHIDTFGDEAWEDESDVEAAYVAEASIAAR